MLTGLFTLQTLQVYYARDVLGNADYVIVLTVVSIGGMFLTAPLLPRIVRVFGKKRAYVGCGVITVVGSIGIALSPPSIPVLAFISFAVYGVGLAVVQALMWTLETDTVEYGEWKSGARTEGSNYALLSFARKVGQGVGGGIAAWGSDSAGMPRVQRRSRPRHWTRSGGSPAALQLFSSGSVRRSCWPTRSPSGGSRRW